MRQATRDLDPPVRHFTSFEKGEVAAMLRRGKIGVLLTDTIYGVVGSALNKRTVERIYRLKGRNKKKPFIVLVSRYDDIHKFGVKLSRTEKKRICDMWGSRPTSVIFPVPSKKFSYLDRGTDAIALRMPGTKAGSDLRRLLRASGPLVAPSANPEGQLPATNIEEAMDYFGQKVDFYVDGGRKKGRPSRLVTLKDGTLKVLRP